MTCSFTSDQNEIAAEEEGAMPKMYRVTEGGSYTWELIDTDKNDKVLARSVREPYTKEELKQEIRDMRKAKVKWPDKEEPEDVV